MKNRAENSPSSQFAVLTDGSSGIGKQLAKLCVDQGFAVVVAADQSRVHQAAQELGGCAGQVTAVGCDFSSGGVEKVIAACGDFGINTAAEGSGFNKRKDTIGPDRNDIKRVLEKDLTGTIYLIHKFGQKILLPNSDVHTMSA